MKYKSLSTDKYGVHQKILSLVETNKIVLEVGCASGYISKELVKKGCRVWGVEIDSQSAKEASKYCSKVIVGDIERDDTMRKLSRNKFEIIILADILEHLRNPQKVLSELVKLLNKNGVIIISVPNFVFLTNRLNILLGRFVYTEYGLLDNTHLKSFTKKSLESLLVQSHLKIIKFEPIGNFTQLPLFMQTLHRFVKNLDWWRRVEEIITSLWSEGLAVQFLVVCKKR